MRPALGLCAAAAILSSGCAAALIAHSGMDPAELTTREEVRRAFGEPVAAGGEDGRRYEDFSCHRKVAENARATMLMLISYYSLGLADLYYMPCELGRMGWKAAWGHDLRFYYDETGRVTKHSIDGTPGMRWPLNGLGEPGPGDPASPPPAR